MRYNFLVLITILVFTTLLDAQENREGLGLGDWKSHLPYRAGIDVAQSQTKVYFASKESLFSVDKEEHSFELYNKVSGLSESKFRLIDFNQDLGLLLIAYENSNIDLLYENGSVVNVNILRFRNCQNGPKRP